MKILVIGSGFLAASIVQRLESEGHDLLVYSRTRSAHIRCRQIEGDIFNFQEFLRVLDWKPLVVIHTAWITTPRLYQNDLSNYKYAEFAVKLADAIAFSGVEHLVILGTCAEYGRQNGPSTAGLTKPAPVSLYAEQKVAACNAVINILQGTDTRLTWARIFYPYGPNQDRKRLIPHLISALKNDETIQLSDISSVLDWITTRDIASAISWVIGNDLPREIDVGTSLGYTNLEILVTLKELLQNNSQNTTSQFHLIGLNEVFVVGGNSPLLRSGWLPQDSLESGLDWIIGSWQS